MRIVTPQNAAFNPNGAGPGSGLVLSYTWQLTETVVADFGPTTISLFVPNDAYYMLSVFVKTNSAAGAGTITISPNQPGSGAFGASSVNGNLSIVGLGGAQASNSTGMMFAADGVFNVDRQVSGLAAGPANYTAYLSLYTLAG